MWHVAVSPFADVHINADAGGAVGHMMSGAWASMTLSSVFFCGTVDF